MELTEADLDLLELAAVQVPWYMVCGEFHERYGSVRALVHRLFQLRDAGLLEIRPKARIPVTPAALEADATRHACYDDLDASGEPLWEILATDTGYGLVDARLGEQ